MGFSYVIGYELKLGEVRGILVFGYGSKESIVKRKRNSVCPSMPLCDSATLDWKETEGIVISVGKWGNELCATSA